VERRLDREAVPGQFITSPAFATGERIRLF
jgi:hypothetical protein